MRPRPAEQRNDEFFALFFEVEKVQAEDRTNKSDPILGVGAFTLNFRQSAALRLRSRRALSSAICAVNITAKQRYSKNEKKALPPNADVLPMS